MSTQDEPTKKLKEIFMSDVQQRMRPCSRLHCTYIIEPVSRSQIAPPDAVISAIKDMFGGSKGMSIRRSSDEKIVVSFSYHSQAIQALRSESLDEIFPVNGCPYRFRMEDKLIHFKSMTVGQRVHLNIKNLPLHMWKGDIVEQVLSPYCALEYIDSDTLAMEDLSCFTCIARSQKFFPIPDEIGIKVPEIEDSLPQTSLAHSTSLCLYLRRYNISIDKSQYLHGITRRYRYKSAASNSSSSRVASPAECFISPTMLDTEAIKKYSSAVVLQPKPDTYFADLLHVCDFIEDNVHVRVRIKLLSNTAFLLYLGQDYPYMSLYDMLSVSFKDRIVNKEVDLIQWTPQYGSVSDTVAELIQFKVTGLPCNLNSKPIIEYMLAPFASVKTHGTVIGDSRSSFGNSITTYRGTAWCASTETMPNTIRIKVLPAQIADLTYISTERKCKCAILEANICTEAVPDE